MPEVRGEVGLEALVNAGAHKALAYSPVWLPATVTAFHEPETVVDAKGVPRTYGARVDVEIQILSVREIPVEGDLRPGETLRRSGTRLEAVGPYPPLVGLPVAYPGPRAFRIRGPVAVGETGWVVVPTRGMMVWRAGVKGEDPAIGLGAPRLESALFVPGVELGPDEDHTDWGAFSLGGPDGALGQIRLSALGQWEISSPVGVDVRAPSTSIGAIGAGVGLAKNAQMIAIWSTWIAAINALPPGPISDVELKALASGLSGVVAAALGTLTLTAE